MNQDIQKIEDISLDFNNFIQEIEKSNSTLNNIIQMDELNEISTEIIKAKEYLDEFIKGADKSVREKTYNQLTNLPIIGSWVKNRVKDYNTQKLKDSNAREVLDSIFNSFELKKKRLIELAEMISGLRGNLVQQEQKLQDYILKLDNIIKNTDDPAEKMKALDMSIIAQAQDKVVKEQIYNNINFIIELLENLMVKISKTLPIIKNTLNNNLTIAGTINSIKDAVEMMNTLEELSNEISYTSSVKIQDLIVKVTKSLGESTDIKFFEESVKRNKEFNELLTKERIKHIEKMKENYIKLKEISVNSQNILEDRTKVEIKALESMKDVG